jgi:hypothetical protein
MQAAFAIRFRAGKRLIRADLGFQNEAAAIFIHEMRVK